MSQKDQLTAWLNDAYEMEQNHFKVLESHLNDAKDLPEIAERDSQHLQETRNQTVRLRRCFQLLGKTPSTTKAAMGNIAGLVQGASTSMFRDEILKNFLHDYAAEQFEIACYLSLSSRRKRQCRRKSFACAVKR